MKNDATEVFPRKRAKRVYEVDLFRGLPIFLVVLYHLCYDMVQLPGLIANYRVLIGDYPALEGLVAFCQDILSNPVIHDWLVPFFAGMFLFACGVSTSLSRNNVRRGLLLLLWSVLLSVATSILSGILGENVFIGWGILHVMAFTILVYGLAERFSRRVLHEEIHPLVCLFLGVLVYLLGLLLRSGIETSAGEVLQWPTSYVSGSFTDWLEQDPLSFFKSALGMTGNYVDWWPIFPFSGVILIGMAFGKVLYGERKESRLPFLSFPLFRPLLFIGGHTLWVYILHQPIAIAVLYLVLSSMGFHL